MGEVEKVIKEVVEIIEKIGAKSVEKITEEIGVKLGDKLLAKELVDKIGSEAAEKLAEKLDSATVKKLLESGMSEADLKALADLDKAAIEKALAEKAVAGKPPANISTLVGQGDKLGEAAKWIKPEAGYYDLVVHGSPDGFWVMHNGSWVKLDQRSMAKYLQKTGWNGEPVRLISCETGAASDGIAKNL